MQDQAKKQKLLVAGLGCGCIAVGLVLDDLGGSSAQVLFC